MKIMLLAPYLYESTFPEFSRNRTGFGIMMQNIAASVGRTEEVLFVSRAVTPGRIACGGRFRILRHTWRQIFAAANLRDYAGGVRAFFTAGGSLKNRLRHGYYALDSGYVRRQLQIQKPDIVNIHGIGTETEAYLQICTEMKLPVVVTLHGLNGVGTVLRGSERSRILEREAILRSRDSLSLSVISTGMKRKIETEILAGPAENVTVIPNGVWLCQPDWEKKTAALSDGQAEQRKRIILETLISWKKQGKKLVICVGNLTENKNQVQLVRALALLRARNVPAAAVLLGNECDGGAVREAIASAGLEDRVLLAGFWDDLTEFWQLADLNVVASQNEGFGLSIIEGFRFGVPSVLFQDLDAAEDVFSECAVRLCRERTDEALAREMAKALETHWDREAIQKFTEAFSMEQMAKRYCKLYRQVKRRDEHD